MKSALGYICCMKAKSHERRGFEGLQKRRKEAARMFKFGKKQAGVSSADARVVSVLMGRLSTIFLLHV